MAAVLAGGGRARAPPSPSLLAGESLLPRLGPWAAPRSSEPHACELIITPGGPSLPPCAVKPSGFPLGASLSHMPLRRRKCFFLPWLKAFSGQGASLKCARAARSPLQVWDGAPGSACCGRRCRGSSTGRADFSLPASPPPLVSPFKIGLQAAWGCWVCAWRSGRRAGVLLA